MSARSVNSMNDKARQLGLPAGSCHRKYKFTMTGSDTYTPDDGPLGWFFRSVDSNGNPIKEYFLGTTMDEAMAHLESWGKEHGKAHG